MGHIFISYSRKNIKYAFKLSRALKREGFNPWMDKEGLKPGTSYEERLHVQIKTCDAYIIIMTPDSKKSEWVGNELTAARGSKKPIFPLLLEDTEFFLSIQQIQYEDVKGGRLPSEEFYERLAAVTPRRKKADWKDDSTGLTDKAREKKAEEAAEKATFIMSRITSSVKDTFAVVSKVTKKTYKSVADSGMMKNLLSKVKPKSKSRKRKK